MTSHRDAAEQDAVAPLDYWERRYADADRVWSGRVNRVLADVASELTPGRALDLGCGEGADVIWLAERGWSATGVDLSPTAVRRASEAARAAGIPEARARFVAADLANLHEATGDERYQLVTASFLHSPVELPRAEVLRHAAGLVASGGHLLITSHADFPPWSNVPHEHAPRFLTPEQEIEALGLERGAWEVLLAETRERPATGPGGEPATLEDAIVLLRRR